MDTGAIVSADSSLASVAEDESSYALAFACLRDGLPSSAVRAAVDSKVVRRLLACAHRIGCIGGFSTP